MSKILSNKHEIGDVLYLKTDKEQYERIVYSFRVFKNDLLYELACGITTSVHYDFEISIEKNTLISV